MKKARLRALTRINELVIFFIYCIVEMKKARLRALTPLTLSK